MRLCQLTSQSMRASTPALQGTEKQSFKVAAAAAVALVVVVVVVVGVVKSAACEGALRQAVLA